MSVEPSLAGNGEKTENQTGSLISKLGNFLDDATIMKTAFYGLAAGVAVTLFLDFQEMQKQVENAPVLTPRKANPILPAFIPPANNEEHPQTVAPEITTPHDVLNNPMTIELGSNGALYLTGFIEVGTSKLFDEKIKGISEYVKSVVLDSPGGSVFDALSISSNIREFGWTTKVSKGNLCASSCPLIFVGGKKRIAEEGAAIGVHQFFSVEGDTRTTPEAISGTQATTARITRHLEKMKVDPSLWVHALETPPQQLYYFSQSELKKFKLVTQ